MELLGLGCLEAISKELREQATLVAVHRVLIAMGSVVPEDRLQAMWVEFSSCAHGLVLDSASNYDF